MSVGTEITSKRPDLPELESVEAKIPLVPFIILLIIVLSMLSFLVYLSFHSYLITFSVPSEGFRLRPILAFSIITSVLLSLWILYRFLFDYHYWKTDVNGLTLGSMVKKRFVLWSDVTQMSNTCSMLYLPNGKLTVGKMHSRDGILVLCSIWQHLRKYGKASDDDLPEYADSFWDSIPDTLPWEIEWKNPKPARIILKISLSIIIAAVLAIVIALIPGYKDQSEALSSAAFTAIIVGFLCGIFIWQELITARMFNLTCDHFETTKALDTIKASFSEVTRVVPETYIITVYVAKKKVQVPLNTSDEDSQKLRLALIRVLRKNGHLRTTPIPDRLRKPRILHPTAVDETMTIGMTKAQTFLWPGFFWFNALLLLICAPNTKGNPTDGIIGAAVLFLVSIPLFLGSRSYQFVIDSEGISKRCLKWAKLVKWEDIAEYIIVPRESFSSRRLIKNAKGKTLLDYDPSWIGSPEERKNFLKHLDSILADKIKGYEDKREWLAQPWEPES